TISQQMVVSVSHREQAQLPLTTHSESVGVELREELPHLSTSFSAHRVVVPLPGIFEIPSIIRTRSVAAQAVILRDTAGTEVVGASTDALRGSSGSPATVDVTPVVEAGRESTFAGLSTSTGAQAASGGVPPGPSPTDSSKVSKVAHATLGLQGLTDSGGIPKTAPATPGFSPTDSGGILK